MESNPAAAVVSVFLLLQLGGALALLLGGLYVLYCLNRTATSSERMADAAEAWLALQHYQAAQNGNAPTPPTNAPAPMEPTVIMTKPAIPQDGFATPQSPPATP